jgi:hypothetical protein
MVTETRNLTSISNLFRPILLVYLRDWALRWPGADGLCDDDVLSGLPQAIADRAVPSCQECCQRHPALAAEIQSLFTQMGLQQSGEAR